MSHSFSQCVVTITIVKLAFVAKSSLYEAVIVADES